MLEEAIIRLMDAIKWDGAGQVGTLTGEDVPDELEKFWAEYKAKK